ncbi:kinase-like domain-containing protein [Rhizophagus clarus]|uniref:Kinase-like domain-containing protein n=1 Tax=Rhizophagus clarus TaxID=94130 RepID=A0A8H3LAK3_9GLOM|nr:kinase-like domain-containing protein [Rhizophagus clarus]
MQLKIIYGDKVFEWIPYNQFDQIYKTGNNSLITIYSAIWIDGPLTYDWKDKENTRDPNKEVALKFLHGLNDSQNPGEFVINEAKKYSTEGDGFIVLYGISQNPNTNDYILVFNWTSGNEEIDDFIQKRQLEIIMFEWISYNQFEQVKKTGNNSLITVYSATWRDGPLTYDWEDGIYTRDPNKEAKKYSSKNNALTALCGISQKIETNDYILVLNRNSRDETIDDFVQEMQLKIGDYNDAVYEWITYDQFIKIRNIGKGNFIAVYSAVWEIGVALLCYNDSRKFLDKVKESGNSLKIYGMSQSPDKKNYILVLQNEFCTEYGETYCKNCGKKYTHINYKWCKQCAITTNFFKSKNEKIDNLVQEMRSKINTRLNIVFEWIPYNQFNYISKEIGKGGFATVYSAIWKDGPLKYDVDKETYIRISNKKIALKCLDNSQNLIDKFLNEVKEYSIKKMDDILNVYGISQNPVTKDFIIVLEFAEGGSYNNWINKNYKNFDWKNKIQILLSIIEGLKGIHKNQKVHHDLHPGNILFLTKNLNDLNKKSLFISDMGLCEDVNNTNVVKIYGVLPYMPPEVLRNKAYTKKADIYSFGMIMYFTATGRHPFDNRAHNEFLVLDICDGIRPEINEKETPKCYIDLMKKCWDSNPDNRPSAIEIYDKVKSFQDFYNSYKKSEPEAIEIKNQFKEAENYRKSHHSLKKSKQHPQAIYTSRLLNPYTKDLTIYDNSECLDCGIITVRTDQS